MESMNNEQAIKDKEAEKKKKNMNHILFGDVPTPVIASCSGTICEICVHWETATFNSNVTWD